MKKITFFLGLLISISFSHAQVGLQGVVVEKYYLSNAADSIYAASQNAVTPLRVGSTTYRVYLDLAPGWKFLTLYGNSDVNTQTVLHPLVIKTTTDFYNDPNNGVPLGPQANSVNNTKQGTTLIDSYLTTGGVCAGKAGVLKTEDTDGSIGNSSSVLMNNPGGLFGAPINSVVSGAQDGLLPSTATTAIAPTNITLGSALDVFDQTAGNTFSVVSGAVAALGGVIGNTASNMVLIGQFTTNGILTFSLNVQIATTATPSTVEKYVSNGVPAVDEFMSPALAYVSGTASTVGLENVSKDPEPSISVYPNPTKGYFTINAIHVKENMSNSYSVYDVTGRLVVTKNLGKTSGRFSEIVDLSNYNNGIYFIGISLDGNVSTRKIIKE